MENRGVATNGDKKLFELKEIGRKIHKIGGKHEKKINTRTSQPFCVRNAQTDGRELMQENFIESSWGGQIRRLDEVGSSGQEWEGKFCKTVKCTGNQ